MDAYIPSVDIVRGLEVISVLVPFLGSCPVYLYESNMETVRDKRNLVFVSINYFIHAIRFRWYRVVWAEDM